MPVASPQPWSRASSREDSARPRNFVILRVVKEFQFEAKLVLRSRDWGLAPRD